MVEFMEKFFDGVVCCGGVVVMCDLFYIEIESCCVIGGKVGDGVFDLVCGVLECFGIVVCECGMKVFIYFFRVFEE